MIIKILFIIVLLLFVYMYFEGSNYDDDEYIGCNDKHDSKKSEDVKDV